jgi:tetratricopeptide (TPR) repeat protein
MRRLLFLLGPWAFYPSFAQVERIDSLRSILPAFEDSALVNSYLQIGALYRRLNVDSMFYFGKKAYELSVKLKYKKGEAKSNLILGISQWKRGNLTAGLDLCQAALTLASSRNFRDTQADALNNIGLIHNYQGDYPTALEYYQKALSISESINDKTVTAFIHNNIGGLYYNTKDYNLALENWKKSMALQQQVGDKISAASCMSNIGMVYADKMDYKMSLQYYFRSLKIYGLKAVCARRYPLENIGVTYFKLKKYDSSEYYLNQALEGSRVCNDPIIDMSILTELADAYQTTNQFEKALPCLKKAFQFGMKSGFNRETGITAKALSELHEKLGHTREAFAIFKIYHAIQDSLYNNENAKAIGKLEAQHEFAVVKKEQQVAQRIQDLEKERELAKAKWIRNTFIIGFVAMIAVALLAYRNFKRKKLSNHRLRILNKEIKKQQKQLQKLNKSLFELNNDLETRIDDRTRELNDKNSELENKNAQLANYAFLNAHKLRAPVATLLGLVMLFENKKVENTERDDIVYKIRDCAADLNDIVREIRNTLEVEKTQNR